MLSELVPSEALLERIGKEVWQKLFQFLLLPDIQLVLLSLDTLYQFTSQGSPVAAAAIFHGVNRYYISPLPSLPPLTFGAKTRASTMVIIPTRKLKEKRMS